MTSVADVFIRTDIKTSKLTLKYILGSEMAVLFVPFEDISVSTQYSPEKLEWSREALQSG